MECFHADAALAAGDRTRALQATAAALFLAERTGEVVMTPLLHLLRARASTGRDRHDELDLARSLAAAMGQTHVRTLIEAVDDSSHPRAHTQSEEHRP